MSAGKLLLYSTNSVSPNDHKNDKIICKYFTDKYVKSLVCIKKNWWNKKLSFRWNKI